MLKMTKGRRRTIAENRAREKFMKFLKREMYEPEKQAFHSAFGMGWSEGKKRQRQLTREELVKSEKDSGQSVENRQ